MGATPQAEAQGSGLCTGTTPCSATARLTERPPSAGTPPGGAHFEKCGRGDLTLRLHIQGPAPDSRHLVRASEPSAGGQGPRRSRQPPRRSSQRRATCAAPRISGCASAGCRSFAACSAQTAGQSATIYVWISWMRARMSPRQDARCKLRDLLWRAWTTPQSGSSRDSRDMSLRDRYRRNRFRRACIGMNKRIAMAVQAQEELLLMCPTRLTAHYTANARSHRGRVANPGLGTQRQEAARTWRSRVPSGIGDRSMARAVRPRDPAVHKRAHNAPRAYREPRPFDPQRHAWACLRM